MPRGGPQPNSGRPKGKKDSKPRVPAAIKRDIQALFRERVERELLPLLDATMAAACGEQSVFALDEGRWKFITDPVVIQRLLDAGETFYRITTKSPDSRVLGDVWDRMIGKPAQSVDLSGTVGQTVTLVFQTRPGPGLPLVGK